MSSESSIAPRRCRRCGWWIAGGFLAGFLALPLGAGVYVAKFLYGAVTGNPSVPGCNTTIAREAAAGPLQYRVVNMSCRDAQIYVVYAKRSKAAIFLPAFVSIGSPIPVSVHQTDDRHFEVVLTAPLADGRASVPFTLEPNGVVKEIPLFDHGTLRDAKTDPKTAPKTAAKSASSQQRQTQSIPD